MFFFYMGLFGTMHWLDIRIRRSQESRMEVLCVCDKIVVIKMPESLNGCVVTASPERVAVPGSFPRAPVRISSG